MYNLIDLAQTKYHIELVCATMSPIYLNTSTLSDPHLLTLSLFFSLIYRLDHIWQVFFQALVDSGSTHYFPDSLFIHIHDLLTTSIIPVELCLFNGSLNNFISEILLLPIYFPSSESIVQNFYVIPLYCFYSLVFGYNWFIQYNLLINWTSRSLFLSIFAEESHSCLYYSQYLIDISANFQHLTIFISLKNVYNY